MQQRIKKISVWLILMMLGLGLNSPAVWAHAGHAGPMVPFVKDKTALKTLLAGKGRKLVKRKEALARETAEWLAEFFNEEPASGDISRFFVAKDRKSGQAVALAMISEAPYHHGKMRLIVAIDDQSRVIGAAVLGVNKNYVQDFEAKNRAGWIDELKATPLSALIDKGHQAEKEPSTLDDKIMIELKDSAVLLSGFLHQLQKEER
ncbi:MAG: hypothetical protein D6698_10485 [Gammaproteobacteria bacterium]|nr:MAG: hypothetical protein D6698_10485 [Gammaproteobacteria bacterium]